MDLLEKSMKIFVMFDAFLLEYDIYLKFLMKNNYYGRFKLLTGMDTWALSGRIAESIRASEDTF